MRFARATAVVLSVLLPGMAAVTNRLPSAVGDGPSASVATSSALHPPHTEVQTAPTVLPERSPRDLQPHVESPKPTPKPAKSRVRHVSTPQKPLTVARAPRIYNSDVEQWRSLVESVGLPVEWGLRMLECMRDIESKGDYKARSPSGKYFGAYQFDLRTWHGVGGEGIPSDASPEEQDHRAATLLAQRGLAPWPAPARSCQ